jgi:tetrahydromethanopterin S-methyltransferase subunit G
MEDLERAKKEVAVSSEENKEELKVSEFGYYFILKEIKDDIRERFGTLNTKMDKLASELNTRIDKLDEKIDTVEKTLNTRIDKLDEKIDIVKDSLDQKIDAVRESLDQKIGNWKMWAIGTIIAVISTALVTFLVSKP